LSIDRKPWTVGRAFDIFDYSSRFDGGKAVVKILSSNFSKAQKQSFLKTNELAFYEEHMEGSGRAPGSYIIPRR
jgi:hypothetical protein